VTAKAVGAAKHDPVGVLALVGGGEWREGCTFDADLLAASGGNDVVILPTAAAYEGAGQAVESAIKWFGSLGGSARGLMVLNRPEAEDEANAAVVRAAKFVYLGGGSPLHLRSVLKESRLWQALEEAWRGGAVLAGSSAGAMVLGDPMVDPRGGAFTLGLGLLENVAVMPHASAWSHDRVHRTIKLAPAGVALVSVDEQTALIRAADGTWSVSGAGKVAVYRGGVDVGLDGLPG
jgi:cyanophycinase